MMVQLERHVTVIYGLFPNSVDDRVFPISRSLSHLVCMCRRRRILLLCALVLYIESSASTCDIPHHGAFDFRELLNIQKTYRRRMGRVRVQRAWPAFCRYVCWLAFHTE